MQDEQFVETTGSLGRLSETSGESVRLYARMGLIPYVVGANGVWLFPSSSATAVRRIKAERLANRGRKRGGAAA